MSLISWVDERFLAVFTRIAHRFQVIFGRTNFFLAKLCLITASLGILEMVLNYWWPLLPIRVSAWEPGFYGFTFLLIVRDVQVCEREDERRMLSRSRVRPFLWNDAFGGFSPEAQKVWRSSLALVGFGKMPLSLSVMPFEEHPWLWLVFTLTVPALAAALYFIAVEPLPPDKSKVRIWLAELRAGLAPKAEACDR